MRQEFDKYKDEDFLVWRTLFERQKRNLKDKACDEYMLALERMESVLHPNAPPDFQEINSWYKQSTGWEIHCVPGLIPVEEFFPLLAQKKFCSSTWLRTMEQLDYLEEPDMFHDIFGHVPLLSDPVFSDFAQEFGRLGCTVLNNPERILMLQRLYWFTIEFGLIRQDGLKIYGAGIVSSFGEANLSISGEVQAVPFDIEEVMKTEFRTDVMQSQYVVIDSFEQLFESLLKVMNEWDRIKSTL
ncbi:MAG: phenylalanine 4-monooxygenase [Fluviicola sp. XM-24bin1]|nr:MAG: phenylalanine 4-monooxygenase [Fluviicola sp. XM-24bin1]